MRCTILLLVSFFSFLFSAHSQDENAWLDIEVQLVAYSESLKSAPNDDERRVWDDSLRQTVRKLLDLSGSMTASFPNVKWMGILDAPDGMVRIYSWNIPWSDQSNTYRCFIQYKESKKSDNIWWVELNDTVRDDENITQKVMTPERWQGALYYSIIPVQDNRKPYYILLGWDGRDMITNRKVIEVLTLSKDKVRLGAPVFRVEKGSPKRFMLDYGEDRSVSLRYNEKQKRIIFDHLAPSHPSLAGNPAFYGSDLTFDAFLLKNGEWIFESNIDITLGKDDIKQPYIDPRNN
ncbi:MAG: hypothetical protein RL226_1631 [Bacteroidota bacterium]|jgi:hypothetical protein